MRVTRHDISFKNAPAMQIAGGRLAVPRALVS